MNFYSPSENSRIGANVPHIIIGKSESYENNSSLFNKEEDKKISELRKWGMVIAVVLIILYAVYRIFFG